MSPNLDSPANPDTHLEMHRKVAVTPLDVNHFQSKAFHAVMSQHCKQDSGSSAAGQPLKKEPSLHLDTPSKFLSKDKLFKPSFDVTVRLEGNGVSANGFTVYKGKAPHCAAPPKFIIESLPKMLRKRCSELR